MTPSNGGVFLSEFENTFEDLCHCILHNGGVLCCFLITGIWISKYRVWCGSDINRGYNTSQPGIALDAGCDGLQTHLLCLALSQLFYPSLRPFNVLVNVCKSFVGHGQCHAPIVQYFRNLSFIGDCIDPFQRGYEPLSPEAVND